jgi:hypothetical protein
LDVSKRSSLLPMLVQSEDEDKPNRAPQELPAAPITMVR